MRLFSCMKANAFVTCFTNILHKLLWENGIKSWNESKRQGPSGEWVWQLVKYFEWTKFKRSKELFFDNWFSNNDYYADNASVKDESELSKADLADDVSAVHLPCFDAVRVELQYRTVIPHSYTPSPPLFEDNKPLKYFFGFEFEMQTWKFLISTLRWRFGSTLVRVRVRYKHRTHKCSPTSYDPKYCPMFGCCDVEMISISRRISGKRSRPRRTISNFLIATFLPSLKRCPKNTSPKLPCHVTLRTWS